MTSTVNKEDGRNLTRCMLYCLRADAERPMFGLFDLTTAEKKAIKDAIKAATRKEIEMDIEGLRGMFKAFLDITNPEGIDERDQRAWGDVADNVTKIPELKSDKEGRKAWYMELKGEDDTAWGDTEPEAKDLCFLSKLRMIAKKGNTHLDNLQKRWDGAKELVTHHNKFR